MSPDDRHAFVTGAVGFTGGHLARALRSRGWRVTGLVRNANGAAALRDIGAEPVVGDLRSPDSFRSALAGVDVLYHIAAAFRQARLSNQEYSDVNIGGTRNVIEAAARAGVRRVVHCSTVGVHGDTGPMPANEEAPFAPPDFYCETKLEGETLARELFRRHGLEGVVFRPAGIHGPGDTRFLKLFRNVSRGRFVMIGSGNVRYHMTYIDDLVAGILLCGEKPEAAGEVFILAGEADVSLDRLVREVAVAVGGRPNRLRIPMGPVLLAATICEKLCRPLGIEPPLYPRRVEFFSKHRAFDISKARRVLGYEPRVSLSEGFARTAAWYRERGLL
jgi:nucleoside-diphosphate-sugar epimerase